MEVGGLVTRDAAAPRCRNLDRQAVVTKAVCRVAHKASDSYWREVAVRYDKRRKWPGSGIIDAKGSNYDGNYSLRQLLRR